MKRFFCSLAAVMVAVVMVFGYVPVMEAASTVPRNVQVPMPVPQGLSSDQVQEWSENLISSFFPNTRFRQRSWHMTHNPSVLTNFFILTDNELWGWGMNDRGQLGDGTTVNRSMPTMILDDVFFSQLPSTALETMALYGHREPSAQRRNRIQVIYTNNDCAKFHGATFWGVPHCIR